jgi:hypothetical protein
MDEMMKELIDFLKKFEDKCNGVCTGCKFNRVLYYDADYGSDVHICDAILKMREIIDIN